MTPDALIDRALGFLGAFPDARVLIILPTQQRVRHFLHRNLELRGFVVENGRVAHLPGAQHGVEVTTAHNPDHFRGIAYSHAFIDVDCVFRDRRDSIADVLSCTVTRMSLS